MATIDLNKPMIMYDDRSKVGGRPEVNAVLWDNTKAALLSIEGITDPILIDIKSGEVLNTDYDGWYVENTISLVDELAAKIPSIDDIFSGSAKKLDTKDNTATGYAIVMAALYTLKQRLEASHEWETPENKFECGIEIDNLLKFTMDNLCSDLNVLAYNSIVDADIPFNKMKMSNINEFYGRYGSDLK